MGYGTYGTYSTCSSTYGQLCAPHLLDPGSAPECNRIQFQTITNLPCKGFNTEAYGEIVNEILDEAVSASIRWVSLKVKEQFELLTLG